MRLSVRLLLLLLVVGVAVPGTAALASELLDNPAPPGSLGSAPSGTTAQGGEGAKWEFVASIATGNPHSDLDFFERDGETFAGVGTLGAGPNGGGVTIVQLTQGGEVKPKFLGRHPSASCVTNEAAALGLQHDIEAAPKGETILNSFNPFAQRQDTKLLIDATDASGRCHDSATFGTEGTVMGQGVTDRNGGLEFVDVTNPAAPKEIGMTSHVGEAHTVNVDPKRPHIAYAVSSDSVSFDQTTGKRGNETSGMALDGFEVVDFKSCLDVAGDPDLAKKRATCEPKVYRYRYPTPEMALGHTTKNAIYGCHELELYPNDKLTCGGGAALIVLDMSGAFDDNGTPNDFTDDNPRGTPLPCQRRDSATRVPGFGSGAKVLDCVDGTGPGTEDLTVANWLKSGAPSLEGVKHLGSIFHMGRGGPRPSTEDIDFNHEAELTPSGNFLLATDERGGGVAPPGASCATGNPSQLANSNGGVHAYPVSKLTARTPPTAAEADQQYARTPKGDKAIYRAPVRTAAQATICTAHVMQQIHGQNRIFMGWYSQGTQVIDYTENPDGTLEFKERAYYIPVNANQWVSHIFKAQENPDGTFTYWGATGDFNISGQGRNAIDVYKVTLPPAPLPADGPGVVGRDRVPDPDRPGQTVPVSTRSGAPGCVATSAFRTAKVRTRGRRTSFAFAASGPVTIDLFRQSRGRQVTGEQLVRRFRNVSGKTRFNGRDRRGRRLTDGYYVVRFSTRAASGATEFRRIALLRRNGRFRRLPAYAAQDACGLVRSFKIERPVFGGRTNRALNIGFRLGDEAQGTVTVARAGGRVVKTFPERSYRGGQTHRLRLTAKRSRFPRGRYTVTLTVRNAAGETTTRRLRTTRL